jgi:hypothetical protein
MSITILGESRLPRHGPIRDKTAAMDSGRFMKFGNVLKNNAPATVILLLKLLYPHRYGYPFI